MPQSVGVLPVTSDRLASLRVALVSGVALVSLTAFTGPADAYSSYRPFYGGGGWFFSQPEAAPARKARSPRREYHGGSRTDRAEGKRAEPKKETGFGELPSGPMQIVVSVGSQRVTLYSNGERVAQGPVSTGMPGHSTPMGVFSIIEKDRYHHSNIYSGAPMPYMQRITWSGVALHEGVLPGYPASHGCIRMSHDFASKLWPITRLGVRVVVARHDVAPVEFQHPKLFVPKQKPESPVALNEPADSAVKLAQATSPGTASDVAEPVAQTAPNQAAPNQAAPAVEPSAANEPAKAEQTVATPADAVAPANDAAKAAEASQPADNAAAAAAPEVTGKEATGKEATGTVESASPAAAAPTELRKTVEAPAVEPAKPADKPAEVTPVAAPAPAEAAPGNDLVKPAPVADPVKRPPARTRAADQPTKRSGQVAVFISRKEKKIFVRQGMVPIFEMPITIEDPDRPLGTHVFTAMTVTDNGAGMRWNLMTIPTDASASEPQREGRRRSRHSAPAVPVAMSGKPASTAAEALDRVDMPKEAIDRISEILIPGSSLIISDNGISSETGRATEFVVLTR